MSFPSNTGTKADSLDLALKAVLAVAGQVKKNAQDIRAQSLAGPIGSSAILTFATRLADNRVDLVRYSGVTGLAAYAQSQLNDVTLNIVTEFTTMRTAMDATRDWIIANFPKDVSNYLLAVQFQADGRTTDRQFTTASLAGFRTQLDALIATID